MEAILTGFLLGFLGSPHCAGMCGPLALALPFYGREGEGTWMGAFGRQGLYNLGRVITYSFMGFLVGLLGVGVHLAGWQKGISIATGIIMLLFLFLSATTKIKHFFAGLLYRGVGKLKGLWPGLIRSKTPLSFLPIGLLNGFLPCGFVYIGLATAGTVAARGGEQGGLLQGVLLMTAFGLGTIPVMASIAHGGFWIQGRWRQKISKALPVAVGVVAILLILRGLSLGIPYISPLDLGIKARCCH